MLPFDTAQFSLCSVSLKALPLTISIGVPLTAEDAVLLFDVGSTQNNVLAPLRVGLAHPVREREREFSHFRDGLSPWGLIELLSLYPRDVVEPLSLKAIAIVPLLFAVVECCQ